MVDRGAAVCHDDEGSLAVEIVDEELEEGVDGKRLQILRVMSALLFRRGMTGWTVISWTGSGTDGRTS